MGVQSVLVSDDALARRVIKRYSNRKLYDTQGSRYVTLVQIADMVRAGEGVQIIDNATKEDKTEVTMALIISEELKERPRTIPLDTLTALIQNRGQSLVAQAFDRDAPDSSVRQSTDAPHPAKDDALNTHDKLSSEGTLEQRQVALESKIGGLANAVELQRLQSQVRSLNERLTALERQLARPS